MENATRSRNTDAEAADSPAPTTEYCPCERAFTLDHEHHDWLLNFEGKGLPGVIELFAYAERSAEHGHEPGKLSWVDLPQFTAMHEWARPADVYDLVSIIDQMVRYHQGKMPEPDAGMDRAAIDSLRADLEELRAEINHMRAETGADIMATREQLATEVRTRRVVVVDPDGFERITAEAHIGVAEVLVRNRKDMHVALVADESDTKGSAEVFLSGGGNGVGRFGVLEQGAPDFLEYDASLGIYSDQSDPRFHDITLDREGLHFGG